MLAIDFKTFYTLLNFYTKILRIDLSEYIFKNKISLFNIATVECWQETPEDLVTGPQVHEDCCDNQNPYVEVLPDTVRLKCWLFRIVEKYSGSTYNSVEKIVLMINNSFKRKNHNIQSSLTYWVHKQASFF